MTEFTLPPSIHVLVHDWLSANAIVTLDDADSASVIDTGHVSRARQTRDGVRAALRGRRLRRIVNTHLHSDHCGGNAALQLEHGGPQACDIVVPHGELGAVDDWDESALSFQQTGQSAQAFRAAAGLRDGDELRLGGLSWRAFAAGGHDPHALMLFQPEHRLLISGDALWQQGFGVVFPELDPGSDAGAGFAAQRLTLQRIETLAPALVIPGHGAVFADVGAALARAHARLDAFEKDPLRHAAHALRVLLMFHLLEHGGELPRQRMRAWFEATELVRRTLDHHWPGQQPGEAFVQTLDALLYAGAVVAQADRVAARAA